MCCDDFYEGQGRLDGAFCDYSAADKSAFIARCKDSGVVNIEVHTSPHPGPGRGWKGRRWSPRASRASAAGPASQVSRRREGRVRWSGELRGAGVRDAGGP